MYISFLHSILGSVDIIFSKRPKIHPIYFLILSKGFILLKSYLIFFLSLLLLVISFISQEINNLSFPSKITQKPSFLRYKNIKEVTSSIL